MENSLVETSVNGSPGVESLALEEAYEPLDRETQESLYDDMDDQLDEDLDEKGIAVRRLACIHNMAMALVAMIIIPGRAEQVDQQWN